MVKQTIEIFARIKPTKSKTGLYEIEPGNDNGSLLCFTVPKDAADGLVNNKKENYKFMFEKVFDQTTKQEEIFENVGRPVVDSVLSGYNGTIFAYGQTGSGKTFTITGGPERYTDRGIIPRTLGYIFEQYEKMPEREFSTHVSYLEIYNENGYDLLDPKHEAAKLEDLPKVSLMEDDNQNIHLKNLSTHPAASEEEALNLLFLGDTNRMIAETPMNQASTRSHCVFTIHLTSREAGSATVRRSKLHLVDLAGSERVSKTGVNGVLLTEAKYINLSLHYLEQVIVALSEKSRQHIPYRNSMMTSVLRDSLGGNCMTTMIATCSVEKKNVDESISTCRFAQRVAMIKNDALLNEEMDPQLLIEKLRQDIAQLKEELALATGRQHSDPLTEDELDQCEKMVADYLQDEKQDSIIGIGADMRKIKLCYSIMKRKVKEVTASVAVLPPSFAVANSSASTAPIPGLLEGKDLKRLQELLLQRDSEINILVNMLKKEKRRAAEAAAVAAAAAGGTSSVNAEQLLGTASSGVHAAHRSHHKRPSSDEVRPPPRGQHGQQQPDSVATSRGLAAAATVTAAAADATTRPRSSRPVHISAESTKKILGDLSVGRAEAFEIFRRDYEGNASIEESKRVLKQRFVEAKALGEQVNKSRSNINKIKAQLEHYRVQLAMKGGMAAGDGSPVAAAAAAAALPVDAAEERMREAMEQEKQTYKEKFANLKSLKTEIEHLQHLLEKSKVKLMKDFELWWAEQVVSASANEQRLTAMAASSAAGAHLPADPRSAWSTPPGTSQASDASASRQKMAAGTSMAGATDRLYSGAGGGGGETFIKTPDVDTASISSRARMVQQPTLRPSSRSSTASETLSLTGDAQADADIMAFLRARQNVLQKASQKQLV